MKIIFVITFCILGILSSCHRSDDKMIPLGSTEYFLGRWQMTLSDQSQVVIYDFKENENLTLISNINQGDVVVNAKWNVVEANKEIHFSFSNEPYAITAIDRNQFTLNSSTQHQLFKRE